MNKPKRDTPLWETAILVGSFILLWAWFLARQAAYRTPGGQLGIGWQVLLLVALAALVVVTVRRVKRVQRAFRREDEEGNSYPIGFPPVNGHGRK